ncbi:MAG: hybrid sensor histidine kinase/response regulator, partial [Deltaproteobacteria bacterium]|nr:hybrid sensor histidine kinase/response regulator [Deltaproteobacteria bacterium]
PALLHQVITNLCTNAVHAMDRTGGDLEVGLRCVRVKDAELEPEVAPGNYIRLSVKDTGPGMSSAVMARIFDPYFTTRWKGHGTGLGLSIVHGIVKNHGGAIMCRSAPGKGTSFEVYFPEYAHEHEATEPSASQTGLVEDRRILDLDEGMSGTGTRGKPVKNRGVHHKQDVPGK